MTHHSLTNFSYKQKYFQYLHALDEVLHISVISVNMSNICSSTLFTFHAKE